MLYMLYLPCGPRTLRWGHAKLNGQESGDKVPYVSVIILPELHAVLLAYGRVAFE